MNKTSPLTRTALAVSLAALAVLTGCMVGPNYHPPKTQAPPSWSGVTNSMAAADTQLTPDAADLAQWWTRFQDPKLTELVNAALQTNLDVQLAEALLRESRAARGRDAGGLWPSLTASGSATRSGSAPGRRPRQQTRRRPGRGVEFGFLWRNPAAA